MGRFKFIIILTWELQVRLQVEGYATTGITYLFFSEIALVF